MKGPCLIRSRKGLFQARPLFVSVNGFRRDEMKQIFIVSVAVAFVLIGLQLGSHLVGRFAYRPALAA